jgi:hypothetical protein
MLRVNVHALLQLHNVKVHRATLPRISEAHQTLLLSDDLAGVLNNECACRRRLTDVQALTPADNDVSALQQRQTSLWLAGLRRGGTDTQTLLTQESRQ